jgi:retron-type reverse transcriptase
LVNVLTHIINLSLENGIFPTKLKLAKVIPLFKQGDRTNVNNYRPISLLPQFSKIFEKVFYNRLSDFFEKFEILSKSQYGFRKKSSTSFAIIDMLSNIYNALNNNLLPIGVFIDLQKAFDTINHDILLFKLRHYGIRGLAYDWIKSYLIDRKQFVSLDDIYSETKSISCGVPQGSILGPLLFLIYINDIENTSKKLKFVLFADDTNIFYSDNNINNLKSNLELELEKCLLGLSLISYH